MDRHREDEVDRRGDERQARDIQPARMNEAFDDPFNFFVFIFPYLANEDLAVVSFNRVLVLGQQLLIEFFGCKLGCLLERTTSF